MHAAAGEASPQIARWPIAKPRDGATWVNQPQTAAELEAIRVSI
jgi:hypothetical protein